MFSLNKLRFYLALVSERTFIVFIFYCFSLTCIANVSFSQQCSYIDDCKCVFPNGSIIDLSNLGYSNGPRWKDVPPTFPNDTNKYFYNPCLKFSIGEECKNVAVCQSSSKGHYVDIGSRAFFTWDNEKNSLILLYTGSVLPKLQIRKTSVTLLCSPEAETPQFNVSGEVSPTNYQMTLTTRCACPDLCRESHLSAGSVLVIIFMIFVALYLLLGIIHSSLTRGAHGWELIPHHEFWADFPLLVRDGCVFIVSGCKPETAYERI